MGSQRVTFITKYCRPSGLNNRNLFSHNSGWWKPEIKVLAGSVSSAASLLEWQMAIYFTHLHMAFPPYLPVSRFSSSKKDTSHTGRAHPMTSFCLNYLFNGIFINVSHCNLSGVRTSPYESGFGVYTTQSTTILIPKQNPKFYKSSL